MAGVTVVGTRDDAQLMGDVCREQPGVFHRYDLVLGAVDREDPARHNRFSLWIPSVKDSDDRGVRE